MLKISDIDPDTIVQLEADSNYTRIKLTSGKTILSSYTMGKIIRALPDTFVRNTRSMVVNPANACPIYFSRRRQKKNTASIASGVLNQSMNPK